MRRMSFSMWLVMMVVLIVILANGIVFVPRKKTYVVAYLGRVARALPPGMHVVPAFITRVVARVPMDEQTIDVPETSGHLGDGTPVSVKGSLRYRVVDPLVAVKDVADYRQALVEVTRTHWTREIEGHDDVVAFDPTLKEALPAIRSAAATWGVEAIEAVGLTTISEDGMRELRMRAALEREQRVLEWLEQHNVSPGHDGRPTPEQAAAYDEMIARAVAEHRDEIKRASRSQS